MASEGSPNGVLTLISPGLFNPPKEKAPPPPIMPMLACEGVLDCFATDELFRFATAMQRSPEIICLDRQVQIRFCHCGRARWPWENPDRAQRPQSNLALQFPRYACVSFPMFAKGTDRIRASTRVAGGGASAAYPLQKSPCDCRRIF